MPLDTKANKRSPRLTTFAEDLMPGENAAPYRARLQTLFAQIEKEFENLYIENLSRKYRFFPIFFFLFKLRCHHRLL